MSLVSIDSLVEWIRTTVHRAGKRGVVLGLSGGIDSAVVAVLCQRALGLETLCLILPCEYMSESIRSASDFASRYHLCTQLIDLSDTWSDFACCLGDAPTMTTANLKARLRMAALYYTAERRDALVVGTSNLSERMIGYFTKYGDGGSDFLPIGNLYKTEVYQLARDLGLPEAVIRRPPSADLWEGQTDEAEIGLTYEVLDRALLALETGTCCTVDSESLGKVRSMISLTEHKRVSPPMFKVTRRAL